MSAAKITVGPDADPAELLQPHAHRPIRAFLRNPGDDGAVVAFFDLVYCGVPAVHFGTACAIAAELVDCPRSVGEVLDGWRPEALT